MVIFNAGTRAERNFEEVKKFFSPERIWQKVLVLQHDISKSFDIPTTKLKIAQKFFLPFYNFTLVFVPLTLNKKKSKELFEIMF